MSSAWNAAIDRMALEQCGSLVLKVEEPPCRTCRNWRPAIVSTGGGVLSGVKLCVAEKMYSDFSCHQERGK